jgi:hypothetical protein
MKRLLCFIKHKWLYADFLTYSGLPVPHTRVCRRCKEVQKRFSVTSWFFGWDIESVWRNDKQQERHQQKVIEQDTFLNGVFKHKSYGDEEKSKQAYTRKAR